MLTQRETSDSEGLDQVFAAEALVPGPGVFPQ